MLDQGVYFDIVVHNTSTILLALHNVPEHLLRPLEPTQASGADSIPRSNMVHVPFRPVSLRGEPSPHISLLARIDQEEYILLPNASALVAICNNDLSKSDEHHIRIVAPMTDTNGTGTVEFEGLWLSKGGRLLWAEGTLANENYDNEDPFSSSDEVLDSNLGKGKICGNSNGGSGACEPKDELLNAKKRRKTLEVITDSPGSVPGNRRSSRTGGADGLLAGVMGWEYLLGEIFDADHVGIGVDGMCLIQNCIGGVGQPNGIADVFFRRLATFSSVEPIAGDKGLIRI